MNNKIEELQKWSNLEKAQIKAEKWLGKDVELFISAKKEKKFDVYDPINNKWVSFGQMGFEDFTKHNDLKRRQRYLNRATNTKGDWKKNKYSPNNLAIHILW